METLDPTNAEGPAAFPQLLRLDLEPGDLRLLRLQGSICPDRRGKHTYFKLRFRRAGRQVVRYLGRDAARVAAIRAELRRLQAGTRRRRELAALSKRCAKFLRATKVVLEPMLNEHGFFYHGQAIRKSRSLAAHLNEK
jgi:hypothetical protein